MDFYRPSQSCASSSGLRGGENKVDVLGGLVQPTPTSPDHVPLDMDPLPRSKSRESVQSLSQGSHYSDMEDISEVILQVDLPTITTQTTTQTTASESTLGKRKLSERSDSFELLQPHKLYKSNSWFTDESTQLDTNEELGKIPSQDNFSEVIAHSPRWQQYFDKYLCHGVQYEIARLVSLECLSYNDLSTDGLCSLRGSNAEAAPKTAGVLAKLSEDDPRSSADFSKANAAKSPWKELDEEIEAFEKNEYVGLGFGMDDPYWYGGKVQFRGKLQDVNSTGVPKYKVLLEKPELGPSCRFTRRFGSTSFLRIKIPASLVSRQNNRLIEFFSRPFILSGRVFRAIYAKDDHIFLWKTNEIVKGLDIFAPEVFSQTNGLSFLEFLDWHNPLDVNNNQSMAKWAARFALGLSNSVPGLRLELSGILDEPNIVSTTGSDMTDGCGYINKKGLLQLHAHFKWKTFPTAIQCRLGGNKGLLVLRSELDTSESATVWIRPSQVKIKYPSSRVLDPAFLIIDVLQSTYMKAPGRLTSETLVNLAANGVPNGVFVKLLQEGLDEHVSGLIKWDGADAMLNLWCDLARKSGIMIARKTREKPGEASARGYHYPETEIQDGGVEEQCSTGWDGASGCPSLLEESVMVLLDAGFTPHNCAALREKLNRVVTSSINNYVLRYSVDVPMSCTALLIPDPFGVLGPGEIQIKCTHRKLQAIGGLNADIILGEVLLTRYPCKLPTDIQKFTAVEKPELREFVDVIICSVQGDRRQADLLAGGDYDGDQGWVTWQPEIVDSFIPADLKHADEPPEVAGCFSQVNETVPEFQERVALEPEESKIRALQRVLLGSIRDTSVVGKYSIFHENATYHLGYDHADTVRLAYMFCKVLDGSKTGLTVLPEVLKRDSITWQNHAPFWKKTVEEKAKLSEAEVETLCHRGGQPFIMDVLSKEAVQAGIRKLQEVEKLFSLASKGVSDDHLTKPWTAALEVANRYRDDEHCDRRHRDLKKITDHVEDMYVQFHPADASSQQQQENASAKGQPPVRSEKIRSLSKQFASRPLSEDLLMDERDISRLRASYAYLYDSKRAKTGWSFFPWDMAMRELCSIKADAIGSSKTLTVNFYEHFSIKKNPRIHHSIGSSHT